MSPKFAKALAVGLIEAIDIFLIAVVAHIIGVGLCKLFVDPDLPLTFALIVTFVQRYQKDAGVGTVIALMLPYAVVLTVIWTLLLIAWLMLGIPFGPG